MSTPAVAAVMPMARAYGSETFEQPFPEADELVLRRLAPLARVLRHGGEPYNTDTRALHPVARAW